MPGIFDSAGGTIYRKFSTRNTSGVMATLSGSPVVSIYKDAVATPSVVGVTLTVDFNSKTGLNHVSINTAADATFYANGSHFELVITTGTAGSGGNSVVGEVVGFFDLNASFVSQMWDEVNTAQTHNVNNSTGKQLRTIGGVGAGSAIYSGTCPSQAGMTSVQIKLDAGASAVDNIYRYNIISIVGGTGAGASSVILSYVGSTRVATVDTAWLVQPDATSTFEINPGAKALVIDKTGFSLSATGADLAIPSIAAGIFTAQMTESYSADGVAPTYAQSQFIIMQRLTDFSISSTALTVKKIDGSTTAYGLTLNSATAPTASTRTS